MYRTIRSQNPSELLPVDRSSEAFRSTGVASSEARRETSIFLIEVHRIHIIHKIAPPDVF